jgi:hypothetical protein
MFLFCKSSTTESGVVHLSCTEYRSYRRQMALSHHRHRLECPPGKLLCSSMRTFPLFHSHTLQVGRTTSTLLRSRRSHARHFSNMRNTLPTIPCRRILHPHHNPLDSLGVVCRRCAYDACTICSHAVLVLYRSLISPTEPVAFFRTAAGSPPLTRIIPALHG